MADTLLADDPQTILRLDSVACLLQWMRSMPASTRTQFLGAIAESSDATQQIVLRMLDVVKNPATTPAQRQHALKLIDDALFPESATLMAGPPADSPLDTQQATFAKRLRAVMQAKRISQQELANRVGVSQPAISQMLHRDCRPQKQTILKLAEALSVPASDLWPDIEVAEMLDAVASFQGDDYVMTEAEANALSDTSRPNRPKIPAKHLPTRRR